MGAEVPFEVTPKGRVPASPSALLAALLALGISFPDNMRVMRSLIEAFSLAGEAPLVVEAAAGAAARSGVTAAAAAGLKGASCDLTDDGFELGVEDGCLELTDSVVDMFR
jgi:hypothetical protein